jgi:prepilin-type N-terminal cleavage/methylation domain-containing protein
MKRLADNKGFTLIEMVAILMIVGVIVSISGMAIVTGMRGYLFAKENMSIGQKAQMAMIRLTREMMELMNVATAEQGRITYDRMDGTRSITQTVYLDAESKVVRIVSGITPSGGDDLITGVGGFELAYYKETGFWDPSVDNIEELAYVGILLDMSRSEDNNNIRFTTMASPRNIRKSDEAL